MERQGEEHSRGPEIWSGILSENALEFVSRECGVGLKDWRWLGG